MSSQSAIGRALGGLGAAYYFRNLTFAVLLFYVPLMFLVWGHSPRDQVGSIKAATLITVMYAVATLLYPYSRFVYERVVGFLIGSNAFLVPAVFFLPAKLMTMMFCYGLAFFIAPIGLMYLMLRK